MDRVVGGDGQFKREQSYIGKIPLGTQNMFCSCYINE